MCDEKTGWCSKHRAPIEELCEKYESNGPIIRYAYARYYDAVSNIEYLATFESLAAAKKKNYKMMVDCRDGDSFIPIFLKITYEEILEKELEE